MLSVEHVVNDNVGSEPAVIFWTEGTASALDSSSVAGGRDVGSAAAFSRQLDDIVLDFSYDDEHIRDEQTGSTWNVFGQATQGELKGKQLIPLVSINHFWFSWAAFKPDTKIYQP